MPSLWLDRRCFMAEAVAVTLRLLCSPRLLLSLAVAFVQGTHVASAWLGLGPVLLASSLGLTVAG